LGSRRGHVALPDATTFAVLDIYLQIRYAPATPISWPSCPLIVTLRIVGLANVASGPATASQVITNAQILPSIAFPPALLLMNLI
jgi:hypothetical protein